MRLCLSTRQWKLHRDENGFACKIIIQGGYSISSPNLNENFINSVQKKPKWRAELPYFSFSIVVLIVINSKSNLSVKSKNDMCSLHFCFRNANFKSKHWLPLKLCIKSDICQISGYIDGWYNLELSLLLSQSILLLFNNRRYNQLWKLYHWDQRGREEAMYI